MSKSDDAVIVLCNCGQTHKKYGIRTERLNRDHWRFTWAFPVNTAAAKREGYDRTTIRGNLVIDWDYPGCPYCGERGFVICNCGHLSCYLHKNGLFTCEWCGNTGVLTDSRNLTIKAGMDL